MPTYLNGVEQREFVTLQDTPASYAGQALLFPQVNAGEDALEFAAAGGDAMDAAHIHRAEDFTQFDEVLVGTGSIGIKTLFQGSVETGGTAGGLACLYKDVPFDCQAGSLVDGVNWNANVEVLFIAGLYAGGVATSHRWAWYRLSSDITGGDLALLGVGWRYHRASQQLYAQSHDGVALENTLVSELVDISSMLQRLYIHHTPGVSVEFYRNGTLEATHTVRVPSGVDTSSGRLSMGTENIDRNTTMYSYCTQMIARNDT